MIDSNYMLEVACRSARYLHDVVDVEALPEYQEKLENMLAIYKACGEMPPIERAKSLYGLPVSELPEWDIATAYQMLEESNQERFYTEAVLAFTVSANKDEDFTKLQKKYKRSYLLMDEAAIVVTCHNDIVAALRRVEENKNQYLTTSIKSLAKALNDDEHKAWRQKTLTSILGLSGIGKSIFLINFARDSMENGYSVLYISTEMDQIDILERLAKSLYKSKDEREIILKPALEFGKLAIHKVHPYDTTYFDIQGIIDNLGWKPDIIYIDYADELLAHEKAASEYDAQGVIYSGLKTLAEINNTPVVTATQTNRTAADEQGGTKKHVGYAAVADSSKKIRLADTLFSIIQTASEKDLGVISLSVIKNRKNTSGQNLPFNIDYRMMRIDEKEKEDPKQKAEDMPTRRK
jgi:hypothetical protein